MKRGYTLARNNRRKPGKIRDLEEFYNKGQTTVKNTQRDFDSCTRGFESHWPSPIPLQILDLQGDFSWQFKNRSSFATHAALKSRMRHLAYLTEKEYHQRIDRNLQISMPAQ